MPRIPTLSGNQVSPQSLPTVRREYLRDTRGESLGEGLQVAGNVVSRIQAQERLTADRAAVTEAHARLTDWANKALYDPNDGAFSKQGKDTFGIAPKVVSDFDREAAAVTQTLTGKRQTDGFRSAAVDLRNQISRQVSSHELSERNKYYDDTDQSARSIAIQRAALSYNDPAIIDESKRDILATLQNQAERNGWDRATMIGQQLKEIDSLHTNVITRMLGAGDIRSATEYLNRNFSQLSAGSSESMQRLLLSTEERGIAMAERMRKLAGDQLSKDGDKLLANGSLTSQWVEANKSNLDPADVRYFYRALSGEGDAPRNPTIYAALRDRAGRGEDVRVEAREALQSGKIRVGDYDRLLGEVEQERPGWYKRGSEYISTMSGVSQLNPDPAGAQNKATMLDQWGDWAAAHPDASDREAQIAYQDIVSHNMLVKMSGLPLPKFVVGSRLQMNLDETEKATVRAFKDGDMNEDEFKRQAKLLKDWRDAMHNSAPEAKP